MVRSFFALLLFSVLLLSGCATPIVKTTGPLSIREVRVSSAPTLKAATDVQTLVRQTTTSQLVGSHEGQPTTLDVTLTRLTYKNPVLSLLVGSSNQLGAQVVAQDQGGQEIARFDVVTVDQAMVNGIAGAVLSVAQDKARVDRALARGLAANIEKRIYGKTSGVVMTPELAPRTVPAAPASNAPSLSSTTAPAKGARQPSSRTHRPEPAAGV